MALINESAYRQAEAVGGESRPRMGAGGYVCQIQAVRTHGEDSYHRPINYVKDRQYVVMIFDVAEGEHAGRFSDEYFASQDKDYAHRFYLSWKNVETDERMMGMLKSKMQAFDESNGGFDAFAALNAEQWTHFVGKYIGLVFGEEEYIANDGSVKTRLRFPYIKSVQDIRDGRYRVPALKKIDVSAPSTVAAETETYSDVPF